MHIGSTLILDTFAEAFRMRFARLLVTATNEYWLDIALQEFTGYGTSVIGCLLYTSPSPRALSTSRMPSSA